MIDLSDKEQIFKKYGIPAEQAQKAFENMRNGSKFIAISGKIGAGKDTVAPLILDTYQINQNNTVQESFAYTLKKEIQDVIDTLRENPEITAKSIAEQMGIYESDAELVIEWLQETINDTTLTSYSRTINIRKALQYWGTEVRRTQDPDYWVKKAIQLSYEKLAAGKSVYITDARFPNEVDAVRSVFGKVIRLTVSPEIQEQRIQSRDGVIVSEDARNHPSETSLDNYTNFDAEINTDHLTPLEIAKEAIEQLSK